ncbi:hypothetical protein [Algoriphagus taiwanensis]|uniref:Uncharacterized protein n=1 Tax=Algoriphagus taiwanensis TaxID=1445656 RepID=A0ABQ6PVA9_9BACT|nr:hypothetical protein Ataiwa_01680 [Algoriphagus taiwanensis]
MLTFLHNIGGIGILAVMALGLLLFFQWLLIREVFAEKKIETDRLRELEVLVQKEISRSQKMLSQVNNLDMLKAETEEKLGLIRILMELMQKDEKKGP